VTPRLAGRRKGTIDYEKGRLADSFAGARFAHGRRCGDSCAGSHISYNNDGIYVRQSENYTCSLASSVMMLRRRAIMNGATDWKDITESRLRGTAWWKTRD
jgi:hypothetical protein